MALRLPIYLDHHATTPTDPRVLEAMLPYFGESFGNACRRSHRYGWVAEAAVEDARERLAVCLGAEPREIVFTKAMRGDGDQGPPGVFVYRAAADGSSAPVEVGPGFANGLTPDRRQVLTTRAAASPSADSTS